MSGLPRPAIAETSVQVTPTKNALNRHHHARARYGNYHNYYFHRAQVIPDARLSVLSPTIISEKRVLDLGCNAGKLTVECVSHLGAASALGIDLDEHLIRKASACGNSQTDFVCADFMQPQFFSSYDGKFDTILLFSITKWLHLHHGDAGLEGLFESLYEVLPRGGHLVVEPQEWQNYARAVKKNTALRPGFRALELRPPFHEVLEGKGFTLIDSVDREEGGFSRPVMTFNRG